MQMGLLTFSDMDHFVIFYPLFLSVHGTLIQRISMVNNPPVENPLAITPVPGTVSGTTAAECKFRSLFLTDSYHKGGFYEKLPETRRSVHPVRPIYVY